jgi:predicted methyltransferase
MAGEIIGDLIVGVAELGIESAVSTDNKKAGLGCLFMTIVLCLVIGGGYYLATREPEPQTKGLVTKKLPDDKMVIKTKKGEDVYTITHELYLNKKVGDSIILNN